MNHHRTLTAVALLAGAIFPLSGSSQLGLNAGAKGWGVAIALLGINVTKTKCAGDHPELNGELMHAFEAMQKRNSTIVPLEAWKDDGLTLDYVNNTLYKDHPGPTLAECKDFIARLGDPAFDEGLKKAVDEAKREKDVKHP